MKNDPDDIRWPDVVDGILIGALLTAIVAVVVSLCGCSSPSVSEPKYPEYDKWWEGAGLPITYPGFWYDPSVPGTAYLL